MSKTTYISLAALLAGRRASILRSALMSAVVYILTPIPAAAQDTKPVCDLSLWQHVYHPERLKVLNPCVAVSGTLVDATAGKRKDGVRHEPDGDPHGWLKVSDASLVNDGNRKAEDGNLVFEIPCTFPVKQADAKAACRGYKATVEIPPMGTEVCVVGSLVQDVEKAPHHYGWLEIHPVTAIRKGKC